MSDKNFFYTRTLPIVAAIVLGLFGSGAGAYNLIKQSNEHEKEVEVKMKELIKETVRLDGFYVDVIWTSTQTDTIGGGALPEYIVKSADSRIVYREYVVGPSPTVEWIGKYNRPDWPDHLKFTPTHVYNIDRVKNVRTPNNEDIPDKDTEEQ